MTSRHSYHVAKRLLKARREAVDAIVRANTGLREEAPKGSYRGVAEIHVYNERASRKAERYQRASAVSAVAVVVREDWDSSDVSATKEGKKKR